MAVQRAGGSRLRAMNGLVGDKYISQQIKKNPHVMVAWKNSWSMCTLGHSVKKTIQMITNI